MIDIIVVGLLVLGGVMGAKRGLIKTVYRLLASLGSLVISFFIYPAVKFVLEQTPIRTMVYNWALERVGGIGEEMGLQAQGAAIERITSYLPQFVGEQIVKNNNQEVYKLLDVSNVVDYTATYITQIALGICAIAITWLVVRLILGAILGALDFVSHLPVISTANQLGGLILGVGMGVLWIWILCLLIPFFISTGIIPDIITEIQGSRIAQVLYNNNLILLYLNKLLIKA